MRKLLLAVIALAPVGAYAQIPAGLGQPGSAAVLGSAGQVLGTEIPFGTTTGTVYDGGLGASASSNAQTAITNAASAQSAASAAQTTATAACPKAGCTFSGAVITGLGLIDPPLDVTLTGAAYTVPSGSDWLVFNETATVAAQTITLPTSPVNGQLVAMTTNGAISALTFSPAVIGWTNPSLLVLGGSLKAGWDAKLAAWVRVQ